MWGVVGRYGAAVKAHACVTVDESRSSLAARCVSFYHTVCLSVSSYLILSPPLLGGTCGTKAASFVGRESLVATIMLSTQADAQRTTTETGPEDPAQGLQTTETETTNKINKCQFEQITKRRNYKRSLLKCVDAMARKQVLRCTPYRPLSLLLRTPALHRRKL